MLSGDTIIFFFLTDCPSHSYHLLAVIQFFFFANWKHCEGEEILLFRCFILSLKIPFKHCWGVHCINVIKDLMDCRLQSVCFHRWVTGEWGSCSITCGKGIQEREVVCVYHLQNGSLIHTRDLYCQGGKPPVLQGCEGRLCLTVWEASEWSMVRYTHTVLM